MAALSFRGGRLKQKRSHCRCRSVWEGREGVISGLPRDESAWERWRRQAQRGLPGNLCCNVCGCGSDAGLRLRCRGPSLIRSLIRTQKNHVYGVLEESVGHKSQPWNPSIPLWTSTVLGRCGWADLLERWGGVGDRSRRRPGEL